MPHADSGAVASFGSLSGAVDAFLSPRLLSGWVRHSQLVGNGRDIRVRVRRGSRLLGEVSLTRSRPDIVADPAYLTEFRLVTSEDIPEEWVAFDLLDIQATNDAGLSTRIFIWDRVRAHAMERLLGSAPSLGMATGAALLLNLSNNSALPKDTRDALRNLHDLHFQDESRRVVSQFESLGKDCSLGAVQRAYGAEPLGLLRFAGIGVDAVIAALNDRFAGVGSPKFTRLIPSDTGEYYSSDTRYGMSAHTFTFQGDVSFEKFLDQQCKKISFLVRNMIEKLSEAEKIFVIHSIPQTLPEHQLNDLAAAVRKYGTGRLLYLRTPSEKESAGRMIVRPDGIMEGYVMQIQGVDATPEIRETWFRVLAQAERHLKNNTSA